MKLLLWLIVLTYGLIAVRKLARRIVNMMLDKDIFTSSTDHYKSPHYVQTFFKDLLEAVKKNHHRYRSGGASNVVETQEVSDSQDSPFFNSYVANLMQTGSRSWIKYLIILVLILMVVLSSYFIINPGERGIVVVMGTMNNAIYDEGLHFKIPLISKVIKTNIQTQKFESDADSASKDLQSITTTIAVNGRIDEKFVKDIYRNLGGDEMVAKKVVHPSVQEAVKAVTAKYTAEELITKRVLVSSEIKTLLVEKLSKYGIVVGDVNMVNFNFSADFNQAIEKKVKAEQDALAEKNKLETVKYQAQQTIEQAKAQAEAIKIQAEAIQNQGGAAYVNLKWIEKRDGKLPITSLGQDSQMLFNLKN